jgi:16S rRNA (uracil1498-N3)-methyltransferase
LPLGAATVALPPEEARHALRVLRLREGDPVELCDGAGRVVRGEVAAAQPGRGQGGWAVTVALLPGGGGLPIQPLPPPGKTWDLVVAAACLSLKSGRDDWLVEKAAELGAAAVLPLATERSPLRPGDAENWALGGGEGAIDDGNGGGGRGSKRRKGDRAAAVLETAPTADDHTNDDAGFPRADLLALGSGGRLPRVAAAATKQCLRTHAPRLLRPAPVQELAGRLSDARGWDRALVATGGAPPVLRQLERLSAAAESNGSDDNQKQQRRRRRLYLVVGPEGDFTPTELEALLLLRGGSTATTTTPTVLPCGLGPNRLRTETAAIAMLSAAAAWVEEREEEGR